MIPKNIKKEHILKAIEEIEHGGVPRSKVSKKFSLVYNGKHYPPKYVLSLANKYVNGRELKSSEFSGGNETNIFLRKLGFTVVKKPALEHSQRDFDSRKHIEQKQPSPRHSERCPKCKETVKLMLKRIYGRVIEGYKFNIGTHPEDFRGTPFYESLKRIFVALQGYRSYKEFVRSKILPACDFFIPDPGIIVEFDESQHFTFPRKITLELYPESLELGFNRKEWIRLCEKINAKDNLPAYRDEQRAWYDTLRDFLPAIKGIKPTIRLFARDFKWCALDPDKPSNVKMFKNLLERGLNQRIQVREDFNPFIARIIIAGKWEGNIKEARKLLDDIYKKWPKGKKVKFIITCGGFIQFDWPRFLSLEDIGDNKNPNKKALDILVKEAETYVRFILNGSLGQKLAECADYITLGIDSYKELISTTQNYISQPHIELVFLVDLKTGKLYWTGKSYPTPSQERGLIRIPDTKRHFFDLDVGKVMILGCHDLTIFNDRNWEKTGKRRKEIKNEFRNTTKKERPDIVLQHPHTTDSVQTWAAAWAGLKKLLPEIRYASAGRYYKPEGERSKLERVLEKTKNVGSIDFVVNVKESFPPSK